MTSILAVGVRRQLFLRKFLPEELRAHKAQWLQTCRERPELFVAASRVADVGPLQALIDELEFNAVVGACEQRGALFGDEQFRRAIAYGAIAALDPTLKQAILNAYAATSRANQRIVAEMNQNPQYQLTGMITNAAIKAIKEAVPVVERANNLLLSFLGSETSSETGKT